MTLKPVRKFTPPTEMVGEDDSVHVPFSDGVLTVPNGSLVASAEVIGKTFAEIAQTPHHDWISYFGTDITFGPDEAALPAEAGLFVVTGEFTKLNPARMTVGELIDAKDKLVAPVTYRVA